VGVFQGDGQPEGADQRLQGARGAHGLALCCSQPPQNASVHTAQHPADAAGLQGARRILRDVRRPLPSLHFCNILRSYKSISDDVLGCVMQHLSLYVLPFPLCIFVTLCAGTPTPRSYAPATAWAAHVPCTAPST
jgi:hypothetical protein